MEVKHLNLTAGAVLTAEFSKKSSAFLIKNFTGGNIRVCLGEKMTENYIIIPPDCFEIVEHKLVFSATEAFTGKVTVEASADGAVEVRAV